MQCSLGDTQFDRSGIDIFIPAYFRLGIQQMLTGNRHMSIQTLSLFGQL